MSTTPTPQKSVRPEYNSQRCKYCREFHGFKDEDICLAISTIENERTAYNALLDKVKLIETERDDLKKRVDSEYDRGVEDAAKVADNNEQRYLFGEKLSLREEALAASIAEAILKLRRVS